MTIEEAKAFYLGYKGYTFHMDREEPVRANMFRMLQLGSETFREWDEELLEERFGCLRADPARAWTAHGDILRILERGYCDTGRWAERLLEEMDRMDRLEPEVRTLILENMAGRTESQKDGGICFFCRKTGLEEKMKETLERLMGIPDPQDGERLERARKACRRACAKWCRA